jgi:hypothetical protein
MPAFVWGAGTSATATRAAGQAASSAASLSSGDSELVALFSKGGAAQVAAGGAVKRSAGEQHIATCSE